MPENETLEIGTRVTATYSSALSLLGLISTGGLAAVGAIIQTGEGTNPWLHGGLLSFFLSLCFAFFAMNCLVGQAKKPKPAFDNKYLVWSAAIAGISMMVGVLLILISISSLEKKISKELTQISCNCHSSISWDANHKEINSCSPTSN